MIVDRKSTIIFDFTEEFDAEQEEWDNRSRQVVRRRYRVDKVTIETYGDDPTSPQVVTLGHRYGKTGRRVQAQSRLYDVTLPESVQSIVDAEIASQRDLATNNVTYAVPANNRE